MFAYYMVESISFATCIHKQGLLKQLFFGCTSSDAVYKKIIELGKELLPYPAEHKSAEKIVSGCQSLMYLHSYLEGDVLCFRAHSDALISAGLAALLIQIYEGELPEVVLQCPPSCIEELGLAGLLSLSRAQGLSSFFLKMKRDALAFLQVRKILNNRPLS